MDKRKQKTVKIGVKTELTNLGYQVVKKVLTLQILIRNKFVNT